MWEYRRDFQRVWEGGKPASWLSTLSMLCHFRGLMFLSTPSDGILLVSEKADLVW
jgi:hypothetical protein